MSDTTPETVTDRDVYITRSFDAPRELVWSFWTDPARLAEWFGPTGISTPADTITVELTEGGRWDLTMVDDETGAHFPIRARFITVREPEYLEMVMEADTGLGEVDNIILRVQFHDHGDKTRITLHQGPFTTRELRDLTVDGWELSFQKLDTIFAGAAS